LRAPDGAFALLGHLRQRSLKVKAGEWVEAGQVVAACGNSGRSAQPHLHLQMQSLGDLGAPTRPLHLRSVVVQAKAGESGDYSLSARPAEGELVAAALSDGRLAEALHLPAGRTLLFEGEGARPTLAVELSLLGEFRLSAGKGAVASFDERPDVLAFYDRQGPRAPCLDTWLLAVGLTPFSGSARAWSDAPPVTLAPLGLLDRLALVVLRPFGATFDSRYRRDWDAARNAWRQQGEHRLALLPGYTIEAASEAIIEPGTGVREIEVACRNARRRFTLRSVGSVGDIGVPELAGPAVSSS
ncbi:MAG TPA: M23 family metallopeptidase, partial [Reyranella sp.]|nr:M23 family metallopeptidase [Reyranella sp.]